MKKCIVVVLILTFALIFTGCVSSYSNNDSEETQYNNRANSYDSDMCVRCGKYLGTSQIGSEKVCGNCFEKELVRQGAATPVDGNGNPVDKDKYLAGYYD